MTPPDFSFDWSTASQALIMAISTWYIRRGSKRDKEDVKDNTISHDDAKMIWSEVRAMRLDLDSFKQEYYKTFNKG